MGLFVLNCYVIIQCLQFLKGQFLHIVLDDADEFITPTFIGLIKTIHICHNHLKSLKYRKFLEQREPK